MDLEHALEIAAESKTGGYDSPTEQALQFLSEYIEIADRAVREECAGICERVDLASGVYSDIALDCAHEIRKTIK